MHYNKERVYKGESYINHVDYLENSYNSLNSSSRDLLNYYWNFLLIDFDNHYLTLKTTLGDILKLDISNNILDIQSGYYRYYPNKDNSDFDSSGIYGDDILQENMSLTNSISFRLINAVINKDKSIVKLDDTQLIEKWKYAVSYNARAKLVKSGYLFLVNDKLCYTYDGSVINAVIPKETEMFISRLDSNSGNSANLKSVKVLTDYPINMLNIRKIDIESFELNGNIEKIPRKFFTECGKLKNVILNKSVKIIGESAFSQCGLEEIELPSSLETIGDQAFYGCNSLKNLVIPENVTYIGEGAFNHCYNLRNIFFLCNLQSDINLYKLYMDDGVRVYVMDTDYGYARSKYPDLNILRIVI